MILTGRIRIDLHMDPHIAPGRFPAARRNVLCVLQFQALLILLKIPCEGFLREGLLHIVIAPSPVSRIKLPGGSMGVLLEPYIAFRCQEIEDVVVLLLRRLDIACGAVTDRKGIIVCNQAVQAFQLP